MTLVASVFLLLLLLLLLILMLLMLVANVDTTTLLQRHQSLKYYRNAQIVGRVSPTLTGHASPFFFFAPLFRGSLPTATHQRLDRDWRRWVGNTLFYIYIFYIFDFILF